jgi:uncharacterized membrane protein YfcA
MEAADLIVFLVLALAAEILGTLGGFGSSLFFVPIAGFFFEFHVALAVTGLFHITSNLSKVVLFHRGISKRIVLYLGSASVLSVLLGAFLSTRVEAKNLEIILGVFLIIEDIIAGFKGKESFTEGHIFEGNLAKHEKRIHKTQKPAILYKWLLKNYAKSGDKILDTHLGSGSIAIACHDLGFDLTGCELDTEYYEKAMKRIKQHQDQLQLFV